MSSRRDEQREWEGDAFYEAWRRGVPEGRLDYDRMSDAFYDGQSPEGYVGGICRRMEQARQEREQEAAMEQAFHEYLAESEREYLSDCEREHLEQLQQEQTGGAS